MSLDLASITFDCSNTLLVAEFWSAALGRPIQREGDTAPSEFFVMIPGDESHPAMMFLKVPEGKTAKNRVHLDLAATDRAAEIERLIGLGATAVYEKDEFGFSWTTLTDPEGNEFCVATH